MKTYLVTVYVYAVVDDNPNSGCIEKGRAFEFTEKEINARGYDTVYDLMAGDYPHLFFTVEQKIFD